MPDLKPTPEQGQSRYYTGLPAGMSLGGYELKSILGQGAFGITYRARHPDQNCDVAIKEYLPATLAVRQDRTTVIPRLEDLAEQFAWGRSRFLEEANTLKKLDGTPSIVGVHDFFEANGTAYMVMELIEGETLAKRLIREERLAAAVIEPLLFPLLDGLEKVHAAGFLHRDIKPANIMVDLEGKPTLIDFGASRAALAGRTTTFTAIFTPGYAALEQFGSSKLGPWTDIYGLAATFYHAITGHVTPGAFDRVVNDEYQPLIELQPAGYSVGFLESIDAGLAVSAGDRPQSVSEWRRMLASSLEATRISRSPGRLARAASRTRRARVSMGMPVIGLAGVVGVTLLGAVGYLVLTPSTPVPVSLSVSTASAEELEQALAERRRADALAADKRRLEEEARQKAQADADAKRQADEALEQTRQARLRAEQELVELNTRLEAQRRANVDQASRAADEAAQRKAEQDAAALAEAEQRAAQKAAADADAKRQADEALAKAEVERQRAEQEARQKAEAEQAALRQASEDAQRKAGEAESVKQAEQERLKAEAERAKAEAERQKAEAEMRLRAEAETAEKTLRLDQPARERLQLALTSLGFDTRGSDGIFGPRTREMVSAWQKTRKDPPTGFLTAAQQQAITRDAGAALMKYDEQKKAEEEAKIRSQAVAASTTNASPKEPASTSAKFAAITLPNGTYTGGLVLEGSVLTRFSVQFRNGVGTGTVTRAACGSRAVSLSVSTSGDVNGEGGLFTPSCSFSPVSVTGRFDGVRLLLGAVTGLGGGGMKRREFVLAQGGSEVTDTALSTGSAQSDIAAAMPQPRAAGAVSADGLWRGTFKCLAPSGTAANLAMEFDFPLDIQLAGGKGTWKSYSPSHSNGNTLEIRISVEEKRVQLSRFETRSGTGIAGGLSVPGTIFGTYEGNTIAVAGRESTVGLRQCTLNLRRA